MMDYSGTIRTGTYDPFLTDEQQQLLILRSLLISFLLCIVLAHTCTIQMCKLSRIAFKEVLTHDQLIECI